MTVAEAQAASKVLEDEYIELLGCQTEECIARKAELSGLINKAQMEVTKQILLQGPIPNPYIAGGPVK